MSTKPDEINETSRDAANWAPLVGKLSVSAAPNSGPNLVEGRRLVGPLQGFGKMWQKTFRVNLGASASPRNVVKTWKENFPDFWPKGNRFYTPLTGIAPGEVAVVSLAAGPMKLSTGVMVLYADEESFTLMTPQGHMLAGWITFSAFEADGGSVAQAQVLMRAQDPLSEIGLAFGGAKAEDRFWQHTLRSLAAHFDVQAEPETNIVCVDPRRNWSAVKNVWHNPGIRTPLYALGAPIRLLRRRS
jgi:hypothetical protein